MKKLTLPLTKNDIKNLRAGDSVMLSGVVLTARDCAHKKLFSLLEDNKPLPFDIKDAIIYYAIIGKGEMNEETREALKRNCAVYFASIGGAGALYGNTIKKSECIAFPELLSEAVYLLEVENFPAIVAYDRYGNSIY